MFNRSTKLTALLVAAASVASMTPVMAAEKLNQKDATIYHAVAYDNGKYAFYGYRTDDDEKAIYYNSGSGKDKKIEDLEDYQIDNSKQSKFGTKYMYVTENGNNDDYLVDLSNGSISETSREEKLSTALSGLISKLKKAERYNDTSDDDHTIKEADLAAQPILQQQFGDVYYQYVTTGSSTTQATVSVTTGAAIENGYFGDYDNERSFYTGFFNEKGVYIDASHTANLKVYNERKKKASVVEKFGKIYKDEALRVNLKSIKALAQDKNYIYALTTVDVDYFGLKDGKYDFEKPEKVVTQHFLQKISKAQNASKVDGAFIPKSVDSWQVEEKDNSIYGNDGDRNKLYLVATGNDDDQIKDIPALFTVKGDNLYSVQINKDDNKEKAKVYKYKLTHDRLDTVTEVNDVKTDAKVSLKDADEVDTKVVKKDADDSMEVEERLDSVSIDVEGNIWAINDGKIKMFDGSEFKEQFKTDTSYNELDVYDKNSLIAWNHDKDSYTTVQEGKAQTVSDAQVIDPNLVDKTTIAPAHKPGWEKQANGVDWKFYDAAGNEAAGWIFVGNAWYYMDPATKLMKTGWVQPNGAGTTWYYLTESGAMKTGWLNLSGTWYYLDGSGAMKTGWFQDYTGTWYYCYGDGHMASNTYVDGYWLNGSGAWVK